VVALNGTPLNGAPLNGTPMNGHRLAPPGLPSQRHNIDEVTYSDVTGMNGSSQQASSASEQVSAPSADPVPWPAPDPSDLERERLVAEVAAANERAGSIMARVARRESEMKAALRAEFVAVRGVLDEMERQHDARIAAVRAATQAEVERILAEAGRIESGRSSSTEPSGASDAY
jgi:hypothetical protein